MKEQEMESFSWLMSATSELSGSNVAAKLEILKKQKTKNQNSILEC